MSNVMKLSPCIKPLHITRPMSLNHSLMMKPNFMSFNSEKIHLISGDDINDSVKAKAVTSYYSEQGSALDHHDLPVSIQLEPISSETHFHQVIDEARQLQQSLVILWMASWCRKSIYLKPKLEKLAAHYYPSIRFFCVDVNNVSHKLVARAEVTKMPSIQLWNDGKKQAEVIGSHKAYLVVNEVREMIENEDPSL